MGDHPCVEVVDPADVVVVGSGAAGLSTALHAGGALVTLLTADRVGTGSASSWAQGGMAAAVGAADTPAAHAADTLAVGGGANDADVVELLTAAAPATVRWLAGLGARFTRSDAGWALGREAGHTRDRILHAGGDATGREITRALTVAALAAPHVTVRTGTVAVALLVDAGRVVGVLAERRPTTPGEPAHHHGAHAPHTDAHTHAGEPAHHHGAHAPHTDAHTHAGEPAHHHGAPPPHGADLIAIPAGAVVLATGGAAGAWRHTTNPGGSRGSGLVLAADAGAELADLQYVQFHPTALDCDADPLPLLTEALRGAGATVVDGAGTRFLAAVHPDGELAPRDLVARAIWERRAAGEPVLLDLRRIDDLAGRFPTAVASCRRHGLDPMVEPVPVTPAAHYHMGGVAVDHEGRTSVPGLWAAGEVARTGAHGANRLASNSLLEALVFGERLGGAVGRPSAPSPAALDRSLAAVDGRLLAAPDPAAVAAVRRVLTRDVGVLRTGDGLRRALHELAPLTAPTAGGGVAALARMVTTAALAHDERRGAHWRTDGAEPSPAAPRVVVAAPRRGVPTVAVATPEPVLAGAS